MGFDVYSVPLSFNGPCAALSGAGVMYNALLEAHSGGRSFLINQKFDESPERYLDRVKNEVSSSDKCVVLAGNHLSCLPVHKVALERGLFRIVLDAHRDYAVAPIESPTHANFLSIAGHLDNLVFFGYRDGDFDSSCEAKQLKCHDLGGITEFVGSVPKDARFYVDIDLDVIDPSIFPATGCPLPGGVKPDEVSLVLNTIGLDRIDSASFEEYIPIIDVERRCLGVVIELFQQFARKWR